MIKINMGAGACYMPGWINVDFNEAGGKQDVICDLSKEVPWADNSVDEILMDNFLEHVPRERFFWFMDEVWRICKPGAVIKVFVPHCTSPFAYGHLSHYNFFHSHTFSIMDINALENYERYNKARFKIKAIILPFHHNYWNMHFLSWLNKPFAWMFNISPLWQKICEKIMPLGFEEVYYELTTIK